MALLYQDITYDIRGACFWVWKEFGGAFKEKVIERALIKELKKRGRRVENQKKIDIYYEGEKVGTYVPDIIVEDKVLIEVKCKEFLTKEDVDQFWKYLKGSQYKLGLLINFGPKKLDIKRIVYDTAREKPSNQKRSATDPRRGSASDPRKGFTLIEVLLGILILALVSISLYALFNFGLKVIWENKAQITASALANQKLEIAHNLPYKDVGTLGGIPSGALPQIEKVLRNGISYTVKTAVIYIDDPFDGTQGGDPSDLINTDYKRVRIEVSWPYRLSHQPLVFLTDVAPLGLETEQGGGTLQVTVFNASGVAVPSAKVHIENSKTEPPVNLDILTNDQGQMILPGAAPSIESYAITVTKDGYSTDKTYAVDPENLPTPIKPQASVFEGKKTEISFAIDKVSSMTVLAKTESGTANWWDVNYQYRIQLKITNPAATTLPSGYSVKYFLDHYSLAQTGKALASGDDIRIVYWNGSSHIELNRINETVWNNADTQVELWFATQAEIPAQEKDSNYYLYYGNPTANTPPQDKNQIYRHWEDFENYNVGDKPADWSGPRRVEEIAGNKTLWGTTDANDAYTYYNTQEFSNIEYTVKVYNMDYGRAVFLAHQPYNSQDYMASYRHRYYTSPSRLTIFKRPGNKVLIGSQELFLNPNEWYSFTQRHQVQTDGVKLDYYAYDSTGDLVSYLNFFDTESNRLTKGYVGGYRAVYIDEVKVRDYLEPEPIVETTGEKTFPANWWNTNYNYRRQLTITNNDSSLLPSHYPVKLVLDHSSLVSNGKSLPSGDDTRIIYNTVTGLVELDRVNATDWNIPLTQVWFDSQAEIPGSESDSNYWLYYGNLNASNPPTTWNNIFLPEKDEYTVALYHFEDGRGNILTDTSGNNLNGTLYNMQDINNWKTGKFARDIDFGGGSLNNYVEIADDSVLRLATGTVEFWFKLNDLGDTQAFMGKDHNGYTTGGHLSIYWDGVNSRVTGRHQDLSSSYYIWGNGNQIQIGEWHHLAYTFGSGMKLYIDGVLQDKTDPFDQGIETNDNNLIIGASNWNGIQSFLKGFVEGFRISNIERTSFPYTDLEDPTVTASEEEKPTIGSTEEEITLSTQPVPNLPFTLTGSKIIGWDRNNDPVYKYSKEHLTDADGSITIDPLEWDSYNIFVNATTTGYDLAAVDPPLPINLLPNTNQSVTIYLVADEQHTLKVTVLDVSSQPLKDVQVRLYNTSLNYDETLTTPSYGQVFFSPLEKATYTLEITKEGYENYSINVGVDGYTTEKVIMTLL